MARDEVRFGSLGVDADVAAVAVARAGARRAGTDPGLPVVPIPEVLT
jgi:hypothetical protein